MSTDYSGSPTAAQTPSPAPDPDNVPIVRIPADGEPANVASANQEWKTLADHIAWLKVPRAAASAWLQAIRRYKNAALQARFGIDHMGFPGGQVQGWNEDWADVGMVLKSAAASGAWAKRWNYYISGAVPGSIGVVSPNVDGGGNALQPRTPCLKLTGGVSGGANANVCLVEAAQALTRTDANNCSLLAWEMGGGGADGAYVSAGLSGTPQSGTTGTLTSFYGAGVIFRTGVDTNWQLYYRAESGAATFVDTGVANTGIGRFRLETHGASESDDGTARVILYVNGALTNNVAVDLGHLAISPFFRQYTVGSSLVSALFGHVAFRANLAAGDVFI